MSVLFGYKIDKIVIYPFGGITKYNEPLNTNMLKEFFVLLAGPLLQEIFFLIIILLYNNNFITCSNFEIITTFHKYLLIFNFLPIIPLDGSKLISLFLQLFFSYKISNVLIIIISYITIFVLVALKKELIIIILSVLLIKTIVEQIKNHNYIFNKFLLERYLYDFKFKKNDIIYDINRIKRQRSHNIIEKNKIYEEKEYLNAYYKKNYH